MKRLSMILILSVVTSVASADWTSFVIRNGASGAPTIQTNNDYVAGATEFIINESSMKAGWGSDDINGSTIADITQLSITRYDDTSRFTAGSGGAVAPYFNIWVTDGNGNYAVVANEPSNPAFQPLFTTNVDGSKSYNLSFTDLSDKAAKIYEYNTSFVKPAGTTYTFADFAGYTIAPPPVTYIQAGNGVGSGAPDVINTDLAYGFNWVFGDTLSNYVSGDEGYVVSNPVVVPEPATLALLGLGGLLLRKRK